MNVSLTPAFQRDLSALPAASRLDALDAILSLPVAFRAPHRHTGLGLRKLHRSGIWEVRIGLDLRLVLALGHDQAVLLRLCTHDEVRRYLNDL